MNNSEIKQMAKTALKKVLPSPVIELYRRTLNQPPRTLYEERQYRSFKHLKGEGIEIGGLGNPLAVKKNVIVRYVDYLDEEALEERYKEDQLDVTRPDYTENGFELPSFTPESVDFIVANHVLEHSPNPMGAFLRWYEVLRSGGTLFLALPIYDKCFDEGRKLTTVDHIFEDYKLYKEENFAELRKRNRDHYEEWIDISAQAILGEKYTPPQGQEREELINKYLDTNEEIHFHTFNLQSTRDLLLRIQREVLPGMSIKHIDDISGEVLFIINKK